MNVNLDVLELIFEQLDGSDLVASALVSRTFLAGAIPSLYARVEYTTHHAKRAQEVMSPFATLAAHDHFVVHVKHIAVYTAPVSHPSSNQPSPPFLKDLAHVLCTAANLRSFACTVKILPPLLPHLVDKPRLHHLRIHAPLGSRQMSVLQDRTGLQSLSLDSPSWNVIDALPIWTATMQRTLAHLTLFMSQDIDATVLNTTLAQLPRLRGLHLIGCPRLTHIIVLKALSHTPDLHELSFTVFPSQDIALPPLNFSTLPLTHLSIDIRASYPGLKSLITRIISRLSPRDALAICGSWIGEIKGSSERPDAPQHPGAGDGPGEIVPGAAGAAGGGGPLGQNFHVWQGHVHIQGLMAAHGHPHGNNQANDLPLLTPANTHHGNAHLDQNDPPPNPGIPAPPPNFLEFPFPLPLGGINNNNNGDDNDNDPLPNPSDPDFNPNPNLPSLVSSLPSTLLILHLPQLSAAGLGEVIERCEGIQVLGIAIGNTFASLASADASRTTGRSRGHTAKSGVKPEVSALAGILSRARALRELIIDTSSTVLFGSGNGAGPDARAGGSHGTLVRGGTLLTPLTVRMLMRESPCLRRIVGEGRIWESRTPIPSPPIPFPHCIAIDLTLSKARYGPGAGSNHAHGPLGFGVHGGGHGQVEAGNDHWFWLRGSGSGGKVYRGF